MDANKPIACLVVALESGVIELDSWPAARSSTR
jgi:hypothetical protein